MIRFRGPLRARIPAQLPALLLTLLLAALITQPGIANDETPPESVNGMIQELEDIRVAEEIAAVGYAVVTTERTLAAGALGVRTWESAEPVDEATMFKVGSVTKAFTGLAFLMARERGLLNLQDRFTEHASTLLYVNPWAEDAPITLAMLLEHSAGFPDMSRAEFDIQHRDQSPIIDALKGEADSRRVQWRPGQWHSYSNLGTGLAGHALEQATGVAYDRFLEQAVLRPLGMPHASTLPTDHVMAHLAQGYDRDHHTPIPYWHIIYRPSGGLNASPQEMSRFLRLLLGRGRIDGRRLLPEAAMERMETPTTTLAARAGLRHGYGLGVYARQHGGHVLFGHGGDGDGYLAQFAYSLDSGRGYFLVITAFDYGPLRRMQQLLDDFVVAPLPAAAGKPSQTLNVERIRDWLGEYRAATWRFGTGPKQSTIRLRLDQGRLWLEQRGTRSRELVYLGGNQFRLRGESQATTVLAVDTQGKRVIQGEVGNFARIAKPQERAEAR